MAEQPVKNTITWRCVILALVLIPPNAYWSVHRGLIWGGPPATLSLFYNVVFTLFVLMLINLLIQKLVPSQALQPAELITIYVMLSLASAVGGFDTIQVLMQVLGHPFWFATPENEWQTLFWRHIPRWLTVSDTVVLEKYYSGDSTFYTASRMWTWIKPVFWWTFLFTLMGWVMLCINVLIRKQWTEYEKLTYPIIQLPMEMTGTGSRIFSHKLLWLGFGIVGVINIINTLHQFNPVVPEILIYSKVQFHEKPWSAMGQIRLRLFPFAVGLAYFIPLDLAFSCWFFFFVWHLQSILGAAAGWQNLPGFPYREAQSSGAYLCIGLMVLWFSRRHLQQVMLSWYTADVKIDADLPDSSVPAGKSIERREPMSYPVAQIGFWLGSLALVLFSYQAGMSPWVAATFTGLYLLLSLVVTRLRAELGHPAHELYWRGPDAIMLTAFGSKRIGTPSLSVISLYWGFTRAQRGHMMPHQLEGFKMTDIQTGFPLKWLSGLMIFSIAVGAVASFWVLLDASYQLGALRARWGTESLQRLDHWANFPSGTDIPATIFMGVGFFITLVLTVLRRWWIWLPLHPVAYPLGNSFTLKWLWFSIGISWLVKWLVLKHAGLGLYRKMIPLFLGLILGEFVVGGACTIVGLIFQVPVYVFWH